MAKPKPTGGGLDALFTALDALTFREHRELADLLLLQTEERDLSTREGFADLLADATDSYFEEDNDDD